MQNKTVTFGELLLRLSPKGFLRFAQAEEFSACFGGAEANVAVSLANFGEPASFVTALPANPIGDAAVLSLAKFGVDTSDIIRCGSRVGIYYMENGASQRPSRIVYDRAESSVARSAAEQYNWDEIFSLADWFHFTGITPALGGELPEICVAACKAAKANGCKISFDPNYRQLLWSPEAAREATEKLLPYVDVLITNDGQAAQLFGTERITCEGEERRGKCAEIAGALSRKYDITYVAMTLRQTLSAKSHNWSALLYNNNEVFGAPTYNIDIVDRIGGGDSFDAGLIYSLKNGYSCADAVRFATAASCLKHTVEGDFNLVSAAEVEELMYSKGDGRVQR